MNYIKRICIIIVFVCASNGIFAQAGPITFTEYSNNVYKQFNINCKIPKNFIDLKQIEIWRIRHDRPSGMVFNPMIQSKNQECILMYPKILFNIESEREKDFSKFVAAIDRSMSKNKPEINNNDPTNAKAARSNITYQLRTALGQVDKYGSIIKDSLFVFNKYVHIISGKKVSKSFNADSIFIYDIPLENPYKDRYVFCTGMAIIKIHQPHINVFWLFTEEGEKNKHKYFKMLSKNIWYNEISNKSPGTKNDLSIIN